MVLDSLELSRRYQEILLVDLPAKKYIFPSEEFFCDNIKLISGENVLLIFEKIRGPSIHSVYKINLLIICQLKHSLFLEYIMHRVLSFLSTLKAIYIVIYCTGYLT